MEKADVEVSQPIGLFDLFEKNLNIPDYQRGYCWGKEQVEGLLVSVGEIADAGKRIADADEEDQYQYHMGTVILHKHMGKDDKGNEKEMYDIVDGQQRLITLALILYKVGCKDVKLSVLSCKTADVDVIKRVYKNAEIIGEWLKCHNNDYGKLCKKLGFCVVTISGDGDRPLASAWTFFNAINSGGKRLSDYDLLKAHHLRHLSLGSSCGELAIQFKASMWDQNSASEVPSFDGQKSSMYETAFAHTFYLIRSWVRNRPVSISERPGDGKYCILNHYAALLSFEGSNGAMRKISSGVIGGKPFFDWTEYWIWQYRQFCNNPVVSRFLNVPWKDAQIHFRIIARAILFYYFCKFGDVYLADAIAFILYRIGKLRNTTARSKLAWYGARDNERAPHTIQALDESPTPEHFFRYCMMPSNRYVRYYNLKDSSSDVTLLNSRRHGPDWWKRTLTFVASGVDQDGASYVVTMPECKSYNIGSSICFKDKVALLFNEVAADFGWEYDRKTLILAQKKGER